MQKKNLPPWKPGFGSVCAEIPTNKKRLVLEQAVGRTAAFIQVHATFLLHFTSVLLLGFLFRMTILPSPEKLKVLLEKVREFHIRFLKDYSDLQDLQCSVPA